MERRFTIVYIDDREDWRRKVVNALLPYFNVLSVEPQARLSIKDILGKNPDAILLDNKLSEQQQPDGLWPGYKGSDLAGTIRELMLQHDSELPEFEPYSKPVLLVTRKEFVMTKADKSRLKREQRSVDYFIIMEQIIERPKEVAVKIESLIEAFTDLRKVPKPERSWKALLELLEAPKHRHVRSFLKKSDLSLKVLSDWDIHQIVRWLIQKLLHFPGVLYNSLHAATSLGMKVESFQKKEIQDIFRVARYTGLLSEFGAFWWKAMLHEVAYGEIRRAGLVPDLRINVIPSLFETHRINAEYAVCHVTGEKGADVVCHVSNETVKREYSLAYLPDNRPVSMDMARVSWTAFEESDKVIWEYLTESARARVNDMKILVKKKRGG